MAEHDPPAPLTIYNRTPFLRIAIGGRKMLKCHQFENGVSVVGYGKGLVGMRKMSGRLDASVVCECALSADGVGRGEWRPRDVRALGWHRPSGASE